MPAIYLFSKRTLLGGDDLQVPALLTILTRCIQFLSLVVPQCYYIVNESSQWQLAAGGDGSNHPLIDFLLTDPNQRECRHAHWYPLLVAMYLMAVVVWLLASIGLEVQLFRWSCHGTPTSDRQPRTQKVEQLLQIKLVGFSFVSAILVILDVSAFIVWRDFRECRDSLYDPDAIVVWMGSKIWWLANVLLVFSQSVEVLLAVAFVLRLLRQIDDGTLRALADDPHELTEALWADRCHWMCQCLSISTCFLFGGQELSSGASVYQPLSQALADYLETRGTLDVVPTDLVTGLLVLQRVQRQRILQARLQVVRSSQSQLNLTQRLSGDLWEGSMEREGENDRRRGRRLHRHVGDTQASSRSSSSSLTLRTRSGSANDLGQQVEVVAVSPHPTRRLKRRSSASSPSPAGLQSSPAATLPSTMDLPETTRLVPTEMIPTSTQPIYRRLENSPLSLPAASRSPTYRSHSRVVLNPNDPTDCLRLQDGARMAKYALSIYTWMLYVYVHPLPGIPRLLCRSCRMCRKCLHLRSRSDSEDSSSSLLDEQGSYRYGTTIGDNLCRWHKESLLLVANIPHSDLIYAQFLNGLSLVPYCILLDHPSQSVIVAVRGSLSLDDLMTDVNLEPESMTELAQVHGFEVNDQQFCHAGVVASARNVYSDLERHGLLERLLRQDYPDYHLRLVGHSLGAGVATLLGYMLKARFSSLHVYNFSPPGCTMTWELATQCVAWTTSFVLDADIVPRLSVLALERLRDEVLDSVGRLKVPKHEVLKSFWTGQSRRACCGGGTSNHAQQDLNDLNDLIEKWLHVENEALHIDEEGQNAAQVPPFQRTTYYQQLQEFRRIQEERRRSRGSTRSILLYPPGRMIHLLKTGEEGGCGHLSRKITTCCTTNSGFQYTPVYIANDDLDEIVVSPTMATDHFVDRMASELSNLASEYGVTIDAGGESA